MDERDDWVADVRRWCLSSRQDTSTNAEVVDTGESPDVGYEAAHPALQSRHWPDAPRGELGTLT